MFAERQLNWMRHDVLDKTCAQHGCAMYGKTIHGGRYLEFCPDCTQEGIETKKAELAQESLAGIERYQKYGLFKRESILPAELAEANFGNFRCDNFWEKQALGFAQQMTKHYFTGGTGNVVMTGFPGVGKSHLAVGILKCLNEQFALHEDYKSAIFMPVARLFSAIKGSFKTDEGLTEHRAIKLLTRCDFLVLDDLGTESTFGHQIKPANDWQQSVLFSILDSRDKTIFTTNFTGDQLKQVYDPKLIDRIFKGDHKLRYRFDERIVTKRRT